MRYSLILIFLLLTSSAFAITPIEAGSMEARVLITNNIKFEPSSNRFRIEEATGTLSWYPRETWLQEVKQITTEPKAQQTAAGFVFQWVNPQQTNSLALTSVIKTRNVIIPVRERVQFPLEDVPYDISQYLEPGEITDATPEIQALAQQLAIGKTDAYEVVYTFADWTTRNVNYSLASVGQPAIERSSEVLQNRYGKCDELTALFISLNRAVGIPARFVAGYSYTNSKQFSQPWGGHGWAEVWLPGQGWIPFDVTYGEYGYLDAGHVTLKVSHDAKETSIDYSARGVAFELRTEPLDITVTPTKLDEHVSDDIAITLDSPHRTVGFGSAILILATVQNMRDYYVSTRLDLAKTTNTDLLSSTYENILLKPHEMKTLPFLVRIDEKLQPGYTYTFPFKLYSRLGPERTIIINAEQNAPVYDRSAFDEYLAADEQKIASFSVVCDHGKVVYVGTPVEHQCTTRGASSVEICDKECRTVGKTFTITTTDTKPGIFTRTYTASAGETTKFFVTSRSVLPTKLTMSFNAPEFATPEDVMTLSLNLSQSGALAKNVTISLLINHAKADQFLHDLSKPAVLSFSAPARALRPGENTIIAKVFYRDELGNAHTEEVSAKSTLTNVTLLDRIEFWLEDAGAFVVGLFS